MHQARGHVPRQKGARGAQALARAPAPWRWPRKRAAGAQPCPLAEPRGVTPGTPSHWKRPPPPACLHTHHPVPSPPPCRPPRPPQIGPKDVVRLQTGGTGYAARDGEKAQASKHWHLGPGSGKADLRGQHKGVTSSFGLRFMN